MSIDLRTTISFNLQLHLHAEELEVLSIQGLKFLVASETYIPVYNLPIYWFACFWLLNISPSMHS